MDHIRLVLGIAAAVLHGIAFYFYARQTKMGQSHPNIATWSITVFLMLLNALTFQGMSQDRVVTLQYFVGAAGTSIVFLYALVRGKFSKLGRTEQWAMLIGISAAVIWYMFRQATWANMIVLVALLVALTPTWKGVYLNPFKEASRSWIMWATAYVITTTNVLLGIFNPDWHAVQLVNPIVSVIAHGLVAILSTESRKNKFTMR